MCFPENNPIFSSNRHFFKAFFQKMPENFSEICEIAFFGFFRISQTFQPNIQLYTQSKALHLHFIPWHCPHRSIPYIYNRYIA